MKIFVRILIAVLALFLMRECYGLFYIRMTHLSKDDLEWIKCSKSDMTSTFLSDSGSRSKMTFTGYSIANSSDPFYFSSNSSNYYEANAWYNYEIVDSKRTLKGNLGVARLVGEDTLCAQLSLGAIFTAYSYRPINLKNVKIKNRLFTDCIIVDSFNSCVSPYLGKDSMLLVEKFIISKKYGPIYYKLKDGEEFFRKFKDKKLAGENKKPSTP